MLIYYSPKKFDDALIANLLISSSYILSSVSSSITGSSTIEPSTIGSPTTTESSSSSSSPQLFNANVKVISATSATERRGYYDDYKDFKGAFAINAVCLQFGKAAIIESLLISMQYTEFLDRQAEAENNGLPFLETYDLKRIWNNHLHKFAENSSRFLFTSWIKASIEKYAFHYTNPRIFSQLVKDTNKSIVRKFSRYGKLTACRKSMWTSFRSGAIGYGSSFIYDVVFNICHAYWTKTVYSFKTMTIYTVKRVGNYTFILISVSVGHAAGSCMGGTYYGGGAGLLLGEAIGAYVGNILTNSVGNVLENLIN